MKHALPFLFIACFLFTAFARAGEADPLYDGLAMHGKPKYNAAAGHVDYANPDAPKGGTLRQAAIGTFDTLNPFSIKGKAAEGLNLVYDRLMGRAWDEPFTLYPLIAERAEVPEDRSSITVHINPNARFHDGTPVTAADVIFSFEILRDQGRPNMRQIYRLVKSVEKKDERKVHFAFGEGYDRETAMIIAMMPVLSKAWWAGRVFDQTTLDTPLLNGPYRIAEFDPGRRIVYERVTDYWAKDLLINAGHYNFDRIVYDYFRDDTIAFEAFKAGDIDLRREVDIGKWTSAYDFPAAKDGRVEMDALPHKRPERVRSFIFNTRRAPFDDIRVRKALELIFDFEPVNRNLFHGRYKRIESYFPNSELASTLPLSPLENKLIAPWKDKVSADVYAAQEDEERSRRMLLREADSLLKDAGWAVVDGKRVKDGTPFAFEILLSAPEDEKVALYFKRDLQRMGIEARIRVLDSAAYRGRMNDYDFDMTLYYWLSSLSPGTEQPLYWGCKAANEPARWNFPGICTPAIDYFSGAIASAKTREDLVATVHILDRLLLSGHYMIPLYYAGEDYFAWRPPVTRPENTPIYGAVLETWWMDPAKPPNQD
jgi:ABC-type oligopeptide transport system substrate-binding subunit